MTLKDFNIDFKNKLAIYQRRRCEEIKPGYAQSKILKELNEINIDFNDYKNSVYWFMLLRFNCKQFNLPVPKNIYKYFNVTNDDTIIYDEYTLDDLLIKLSHECHTMIEQLKLAI